MTDRREPNEDGRLELRLYGAHTLDDSHGDTATTSGCNDAVSMQRYRGWSILLFVDKAPNRCASSKSSTWVFQMKKHLESMGIHAMFTSLFS